MSSKAVMKGMIGFYIVLFFVYLFGPLVVMTVTAFNTPNYPQAWPFEAFTLHWFAALAGDDELVEGIQNSLVIGALVVAIAVPIGLAVHHPWRALPVITAPLALIRFGQLSLAGDGPTFNELLAQTGQLLLLHGVLFTAGLVM